MSTTIALYTIQNSNRLFYVINFLEGRLGVKFQVITDYLEFNNTTHPKVNYSNQKWDGVSIHPHGLLYENNIHSFDFASLEKDVFSMIFFLLSRYEEYLPFEADDHGRFTSKSSYLQSVDKLQIPYADVLIEDFKNQIKEKYPKIVFQKHNFHKKLTIDIDQAFLFQHKSFIRFVGGNIKDARHFNFRQILQRKLSYFKLQKDPWNVYDELEKKLSQHQAIFFLQVGEYGKFDKNLSIENSALRKLIRRLNTWTTVGLHPSYQSNQDIEMLKMEKTKLEELLGKPITKSRQHYIKLHLPQTYRNLLTIGITDDYSMGFADSIGFRAGTSFDFYWYDLLNEEQTNLKIHPFCVMDVTLKDYMKLRWEHGNFVLKRLEEDVQKVDGTMTLIAHNESLSGYAEWAKWNEVLLDFVLS